jgi:hypothetical protein
LDNISGEEEMKLFFAKIRQAVFINRHNVLYLKEQFCFYILSRVATGILIGKIILTLIIIN